MSSNTIICPNCKTDIPLSEALTKQVEQEYQAKFELEKEKIKKELWVVAQKKALEKSQKEILEQQKEKDKKLSEMQEQLLENAKKLAESEANELNLRKKARELEEKEKKIELEFQRKIDEEREKIAEEVRKLEDEKQSLKLQEKDKQLDMMRKQIDDLKRKAEQGSMQIQGEVQEAQLRELLQNTFVVDEILDVPAGINGADLIQNVNGKLGAKAGVILWESKNTKTFSEKWLTKLKADQGIANADIAILISQSLPDDIQNFAYKNGVFVSTAKYAMALASVLRMQLIEIAKVKTSLENKDEKMDLLYKYLSGPTFKNRIENIVISFVNLKSDLETEKRSMQRIWSKREQELEKAIMSTSSFYGDLQGIIGGSLPTIEKLEMGPEFMIEDKN